MYSTLVINIDIIKFIGIVCTIIGASTLGAWHLNGRFSKTTEKLRNLEKTVDELRTDTRELFKQNDHTNI